MNSVASAMVASAPRQNVLTCEPSQDGSFELVLKPYPVPHGDVLERFRLLEIITTRPAGDILDRLSYEQVGRDPARILIFSSSMLKGKKTNEALLDHALREVPQVLKRPDPSVTCALVEALSAQGLMAKMGFAKVVIFHAPVPGVFGPYRPGMVILDTNYYGKLVVDATSADPQAAYGDDVGVAVQYIT